MKSFVSMFTAGLLLAATLAAQAQNQPIYRCGNGVYQQRPCEGGTVLEATDRRSAAQRAEALRAARPPSATASAATPPLKKAP